jgi:two-component system, NarL family, response regulator LiaR
MNKISDEFEVCMDYQPIKVLVVDDHAMVRKGVKALLGEYDDVLVIGEASDGLKAIELVKSLKPDVILLDLLMPVMDGIETTKRIIAIQPDQRIIVLTAYMGDDILAPAMDAGAAGYLVKNIETEELIQSIRNVCTTEQSMNTMIAWKDLNGMYCAKTTKKLAEDLRE